MVELKSEGGGCRKPALAAVAAACVALTLAPSAPSHAADSPSYVAGVDVRPEDAPRRAGFAAITPEYEPALLVAVRLALNRSDWTAWTDDDGRAGYVSVSVPWVGRGHECRLYHYTVYQDGLNWLSPDILACRGDPAHGWNLHAGRGW